MYKFVKLQIQQNREDQTDNEIKLRDYCEY